MIEKVKKVISEHNMLENGAQVIIGLSGGPDSVCLFDILDEIAGDYKLDIHPVHINHGIRGKDADSDEKFCEALVNERGYELRTFAFNCEGIAKERGLTTEEAGRELRYEAFGTVADELDSENVVIALAQNRDDQAETVIFRILRGTGIDGLGGIPYVREDKNGNRIIRPLLDASRSEIIAYLRDRGLEYCVDQTNEEAIYTRNKIRLELIPKLEEEYNSGVKDALVRLARSAREEVEFLEGIAIGEYEKLLKENSPSRILLNGDGLRRLDRALSRRIISMALKELGLEQDMNRGAYEEVFKIIESKNPSAKADLPGGYYIANVYSDLALGKVINDTDIQQGDNIECPYKLQLRRTAEELPEGLKILCSGEFSEKALREEVGDPANAVLRGRRAGDMIKLPGGSKKLQDLLVDRKIPKERREKLLLAAIGNRILMVYDSDEDVAIISSSARVKEPGEDSIFVEITVPV